MGFHEGRMGVLKVDGGAGYTEIGGVTDVSMTLTQGEIETTVHGSSTANRFRQYIPGRTDGTISVSCIFDDTDTAQNYLIQSWDPGDAIAATLPYQFQLTSAGTGDNDLYSASAFVTDLSYATPNDDVTTLDISLRLTGAVTLA